MTRWLTSAVTESLSQHREPEDLYYSSSTIPRIGN